MAIGDFLSKFGVPGAGAGEFSAPADIIVYNSEVYVVDSGNTRVQVFNLSGTYQREWSTGGTSPKGIAEMSGEIYVTDSNAFAGVVTVFNTVGAVQRAWGGWGAGDGDFQAAWDIASYNNEVYVADAGNNRIQVFNSIGVFQRKWGTSGAGDGQFSFPSGVAVYNDEVYVTDYSNNRIQVFSTAGVFQRKWGTPGAGDGNLSQPRGIEVWDDKVYVVDLGNDRCQVFDLVGTFTTKWGTLGVGNGQFDTPAFLAIDGATSIYVTDGNARVQIFSNTASTQTRVPTSDLVAQWTPSSGVDHYALVDEYPATNDADYNYSVTYNAADSFGFTVFAIPANATIVNVKLHLRAKRNTENRTLNFGLMIHDDHWWTGVNITATSFTNYSVTWTVNPHSGLAWTVDDVNSVGINGILAFAYLLGYAANGDAVYVSRAYLEVNFVVPLSPTNEELMRHLKWFHDGEIKGCWRG